MIFTGPNGTSAFAKGPVVTQPPPVPTEKENSRLT